MTEIDISRVLIEGDTATIMGVKYQRVIETSNTTQKIWKAFVDELTQEPTRPHKTLLIPYNTLIHTKD